MNSELQDYTIEADDDGCWLVGHGEYESSSILAGQYRRCLIRHYDSMAEAQAACPTAQASNPTHSEARVSDCPPDDFDPADAGEVWGENDY